jgi:hypothetical protein
MVPHDIPKFVKPVEGKSGGLEIQVFIDFVFANRTTTSIVRWVFEGLKARIIAFNTDIS